MKLNILTYSWHTGHQYELFKLPFRFLLYQSPENRLFWNHAVRPLPWNVQFISKLDKRHIDIAILPFDENILTPTIHESPLSSDWGNTFHLLFHWCREHRVPMVGLCHGTVPRKARFKQGAQTNWQEVDELAVTQFRHLLKGTPVVCNSQQAFREWGFEGKAIIHGFDPDEYPIGPRKLGVLMTSANILTNTFNQGGWIFEHCAKEIPLNLLGTDKLFGSKPPCRIISVPDPQAVLPKLIRKRCQRLEKWLWAKRKYMEDRKTVGMFSIYLNTTQFSTMPRSRAEAMLCGLSVVTTPYYDIDQFIKHGV